MPMRLPAVLFLITVFLAGCSGSETSSEPTGPPSTEATTTSAVGDPVGTPPALQVKPIAKLTQPTAMATRPGDESLYVVEKPGSIRAIRNGKLDETPVLDIRSQVSKGSEQGLLGLAFAPDRPVFYINYTDTNGDTHIDEYKLDDRGRGDIRSKREILTVDQPFPNHNGGQLAFGPDNALYIGLGDGGSAGDPQKNAQNLTVLLGKILRIRPETPSGGLPYTIPFDNPLTRQAGARGEIWAYGLRNPWRFSFDKTTRALWIADVGQDNREEINLKEYNARGGDNYGWPLREGTRKQDGDKPKGAIDPIHEYGRDGGACSVTGGYVYRGSAIPDMRGRYLFGDFCTGDVSTLTKRGTSWEPDKTNLNVPTLASFGQDNNGEIYTIGLSGDVSRLEAKPL